MQLQPALCFAALLLRPSNDFFHRFLSLYDEKRGTVSILRGWTDHAVLSPYEGLIKPAPILEVRCLLKLHDLVRAVTKGIDHEE
jgi:hypothetical protein